MSIPIEEYYQNEDGQFVTHGQIIAYHTEKESKKFQKWMGGQTVMDLKGGEEGIHICDYERWLREGKKTEQNVDTWD